DGGGYGGGGRRKSRGDTEVKMVVDTRVEAMVVMDTEAMNTKVDTEVETVVTIDTVNEVVWLWM
ncbi:unnamed protein product, partial [Brassica oleracea]